MSILEVLQGLHMYLVAETVMYACVVFGSENFYQMFYCYIIWAPFTDLNPTMNT